MSSSDSAAGAGAGAGAGSAAPKDVYSLSTKTLTGEPVHLKVSDGGWQTPPGVCVCGGPVWHPDVLLCVCVCVLLQCVCCCSVWWCRRQCEDVEGV